MVKRSKYSEKTLCFTVVNHSKFTVVNHSKFTVVNHSKFTVVNHSKFLAGMIKIDYAMGILMAYYVFY